MMVSEKERWEGSGLQDGSSSGFLNADAVARFGSWREEMLFDFGPTYHVI